MTVAGKKFKDIYDSGVKVLSDIESQSIAEMHKAKEEHTESQKEAAQHSLKQLEEKSSLLQDDLKQSISHSLKKLENKLSIENTQCEAFVSSLVSELKTLTEQMKLKLLALKKSHQENVDYARTLASEECLTDSEDISFQLEQSLSQSIDYISNQGKLTLDSINNKFEKLLSQIHIDVDATVENSLVSSEENINAIEEHSVALQQSLSVDNQSSLKSLQAFVRNVNQDLETSARNLLEVIASQAATIEKDINNSYDEITTNHYQNADNRLSNCADQLSELHDAVTEQLVNQTDQFSADLLLRSAQVQQGLKATCDEVLLRVDTSFENFKSKQTERLNYCRGQKQILEADKHRIVMAIQSELLSIQKSFEKKIATVFEQSKSELSEITQSVEIQIGFAIQSFDKKMDASTQAIQKQIDDEVNAFLKELSSARSDAISEIVSAAKGNMPLAKSSRLDMEDDSSLNEATPLAEQTAADSDANWLYDDIQDLKSNTNIDKNQSDDIIDSSDLSENGIRRHRSHKEGKE